jgi:hypothetical protein
MNNNLMQIEDEEEPHVVVSEHHMQLAQAVVDHPVVQSTRKNYKSALNRFSTWLAENYPAISSFGWEFKLFDYQYESNGTPNITIMHGIIEHLTTVNRNLHYTKESLENELKELRVVLPMNITDTLLKNFQINGALPITY